MGIMKAWRSDFQYCQVRTKDVVNKRMRKPKGQSIMDNTETLATLGACAHDRGRRQTKQITQHRKLKR
jgi:hypothetical protein